MLTDYFQGGKIPEDFVWCGICSNPILVFHYLKLEIQGIIIKQFSFSYILYLIFREL